MYRTLVSEDSGQDNDTEAPLFVATMNDRLRGFLRSIGYPDVNRIPDEELADVVSEENWKREEHRDNRAALPEWIKQGYVTAQEGYKLRRWQLRELAHQIRVLERANKSLTLTQSREPVPQTAKPQPIPGLTRGEVLSLFAEAVTVIVALQAQIEELTEQVAAVKDAKLAVFGKQEVIDQLSNAPRDFEGVDVTMDLAEDVTVSSDDSTDGTENTNTTTRKKGDISAHVDGLASMVAGLNLGGVVDTEEMNTVAQHLKTRSRARAKTKTHAKVRIKIAKVSGGGGKL